MLPPSPLRVQELSVSVQKSTQIQKLVRNQVTIKGRSEKPVRESQTLSKEQKTTGRRDSVKLYEGSC